MTDYEKTTPIVILDKSTSGYCFNSSDRNICDSKDDGRTLPIDHSYTHQCGALLKVLSLFAIMPNSVELADTWQQRNKIAFIGKLTKHQRYATI